MWTFGSTTARLRRLEEENIGLRKAVDRLEDLPLKWENTLDLMKKLVGRLNARDKTLNGPEGNEQPAGDGPPPDQAATGTHGRLQAMRRRRGLLSG